MRKPWRAINPDTTFYNEQMYKEPPRGLSIGFSPSSPHLKMVRNKFADIPSVALRSPESTTSLLSQKKKEMVDMVKHRKKS